MRTPRGVLIPTIFYPKHDSTFHRTFGLATSNGRHIFPTVRVTQNRITFKPKQETLLVVYLLGKGSKHYCLGPGFERQRGSARFCSECWIAIARTLSKFALAIRHRQSPSLSTRPTNLDRSLGCKWFPTEFPKLLSLPGASFGKAESICFSRFCSRHHNHLTFTGALRPLYKQ